ncbi:MAG: type II secretion system-associated lipoprotein [Spirochaetota bacterium]
MRTVFLWLLILSVVTGCSSFIKKEQVDEVKQYEYYIFTLKEDVVIDEEVLLTKGTDVRLYFITSNDFIKVYAYPADQTYLKSEHSLLLYLFEEDFSNETFSKAHFDQKLFSMVERKERTSVKPGNEPER